MSEPVTIVPNAVLTKMLILQGQSDRFKFIISFTTIINRFTIFFVTLVLCQSVAGQTKLITGIVTDSATHTPLPNVSIGIKNSGMGTITNAAGRFRIVVDKGGREINFSTTGYHPSSLALTDDPDQQLEIRLSKAYTELKDVVVKAKRGRYRNKNNPAVELIRQVIANKSKNGPGASPYLSYRQYEKTRILTDKAWDRVTDNKLLRRYRFFTDNVDTTIIPGKSLISVYLQEIYSENYYRKHPEKKKQVIVGKKSVDYGEYIDMTGISMGLSRLYEDINIYDNNISIFTTQFLSPVANLAPDFYMYFIRDTIVEEGVKLVKLYFTPRNPEDLLLRGTLYITLDGNYAIRRVELGLSKVANLNWARDLRINQEFEKGPGERYHLSMSDMAAWYRVLPKTPGFYGERTVWITQMTDTVLPDTRLAGLQMDSLPQSARQPGPFWDENRAVPLNPSEEMTYANTERLVKMRSYKRIMDWITVYNAGYKSAGIFDIGPVGRFYTFNPVEGSRLRFGGRSNTKLSKVFFTSDYIAYGFKDERWKYSLTQTLSLNHKSIYTYPFHYIQASFLHDTRNPGQEDVFSEGNTFLSSFARGYNSSLLYNDIFRLSYVREFGEHLSYTFGTKYWKQMPAGSLAYVNQPVAGELDTIRQITTGEFSASLRWAPHEEFFQNKVSRADIINKYPIITLQVAQGIQGLYGGQYGYGAVHLNLYKRFYVSPLGYSDVIMDAGYLGGVLPFPLLVIHPANESYFYSGTAYNLMNTEEFVSDHYASININHYFNGFFLNKIPLVKKLRLREVVTAKILYGGLRKENDPATNPEAMLFPTINGVVSTFVLNGQPYVEAGVGIDNIFSFIRVDLIKRFTYLDHPGISTLGLRFSSNFHF